MTGPIPINCHGIITAMPDTFSPDIAGDLSAGIQFQVSGAEPGTYYLNIEGKQCTFHKGKIDAPATPSQVWLAIAQGALSGVDAFMQEKYKAEGDLDLLLKMPEIFQKS